MDSVLRNAAFTAQITNVDATGTAADIPGGITNATVVDSAGVAISGSPFAVTSVGSGVYTISIPPQPVLDQYAVTWNVADGSKRYSNFEVIGGQYFSIPEIKAFEPQLSAVPAATIRDRRDDVEEWFEEIAHVAFVPRGRRWRADGSGTQLLMLPDTEVRSVVAVTVDGVALSAPDIAALSVYDWGAIWRTSTVWAAATATNPQNVLVLYEHGMDEPPTSVKRAAMELAAYLCLPHPGDDGRTIGLETDIGFIRRTVARDGKTGFPQVDSVLQAFGRVAALVR